MATRTLCEQVGLSLDAHGNALCPFHADKKSKSLKVYGDPARGWHCFGCGMGGSVIDFAMAWYGIGFRQAITRLDADYALGLPLTARPTAQDAHRAAERARIEREAHGRELSIARDAEAAYWTCFERYLACVRTMDEYRPKSPEEDFDVRWADAAQLLPQLRDDYERALDAWEEVRRNAERSRRKTPRGDHPAVYA